MKKPAADREFPRPIPGWRPTTPALLPAEFEAVVGSHRVVAVHFWAVWDGYDILADEYLQPCRTEFADRIHFRSFDLDCWGEAPHIFEKVRVINIPALVCFVDGEPHDILIGVGSAERWYEKVREWAELGSRNTT